MYYKSVIKFTKSLVFRSRNLFIGITTKYWANYKSIIQREFTTTRNSFSMCYRLFIFRRIMEEISKKKVKKLFKNNNRLKIKLKIKTKALWFASQVIQEKIEPNKTVDEVYEMLKIVGKSQVIENNPELFKIIK